MLVKRNQQSIKKNKKIALLSKRRNVKRKKGTWNAKLIKLRNEACQNEKGDIVVKILRQFQCIFMKKNILSQDLFEIYFITCSKQFYTCIESTFFPNSRYLIECALHYVKSVRILSFSRQYFLAFGLNTE